ncbi:MAG: RidA family protein [Candidatus Omnitrophica bacterium]|nr:RidA family protein [Candidatus Omnitrophota bacterium]
MKIVKTDKAPAAVGPYSQAVITGNLVFCAGQIPLDPANGNVVAGGIEEQTHRVCENIKGVLAGAGTSIEKVVKATVFLKDMNDFAGMNKVYSEYFKANFPARSTLQVARIPKDCLVEIEVVAELA